MYIPLLAIFTLFFLHFFRFPSYLFPFRLDLYVPRRSPTVPDIRYTWCFRGICHTFVERYLVQVTSTYPIISVLDDINPYPANVENMVSS